MYKTIIRKNKIFELAIPGIKSTLQLTHIKITEKVLETKSCVINVILAQKLRVRQGSFLIFNTYILLQLVLINYNLIREKY